MRTIVLNVLALISATSAAPSYACIFESPPVAETVSQVATEGVLISGHVIQGFDAEKEQPEVIRADQIFVGEGKPRDFTIYRSRPFYEQARSRLRKTNEPKIACSPPATYGLGRTFERLVLMPAMSNGKDRVETWSVHFWGGNVSMGRGLDMLIKEAIQTGRFQGRPPKSQKWGDCMECVSPDGR